LIPDLMAKGTASGVAVSEKTALSVTAVWACVRLIAHAIAVLPLPVYKKLTPRGKERATEHPLYRLLHDRPNPEISSFQFRSLLSVHQNLWGVGIAEIVTGNSGRAEALWPLPPWRVSQRKITPREVVYDIRLDDGTTRTLPSYRCLVFPSMQIWSDEWLSPISVHRETVGFATALSDFGAKTFGQGTNPAGIITHPGKLRETSEESMRARFKPYEGLSGSHRLMLLEEGMKFERVGLPPEDAQYLQTRQFSISEISRIYNVPLHLLQEHTKSTSWGSGIEELNLAFVNWTLQPYLTQWEQEISAKLFAEDEPYFAEFLLTALLRGRTSERYAAYATGRQWGWLSVNDVRELENMNPIDDGDIYLVPGNMTPADKAGEMLNPPPPKDNGDDGENETTEEP